MSKQTKLMNFTPFNCYNGYISYLGELLPSYAIQHFRSNITFVLLPTNSVILPSTIYYEIVEKETLYSFHLYIHADA